MASKKPYDLRTLLAAQKAIGVLESLGLKALTADVYLVAGHGHVFMCARGAFYVGDQTLEDRRRIAATLHEQDRGATYELATDYLIGAKHYDSRTVDAIEHVNQTWRTGDYHPNPSTLMESQTRLQRVKSWIAREIRRARKARSARKKIAA